MNTALSPLEAATIADDVEVLAFLDLYDGAPASMRSQLGLRIERIADATLLMAPGLPSPMFNRVIGLGLRQPAGADDLDALTRAYSDSAITNWWLHWNPLGQPADLPRQLADRGFTQPARRSWAKVLRGTTSAPTIATDLQIGTVADHDAERTAQAVAQSYEMPSFMVGWFLHLHTRPGWQFYSVKDGSEVVGGGFLFLQGAVAWLGMGAVLPAYRRRGGQGALMALRISDAIAAGARHIVTETGEAIADEPNPSLANMKRCGFVTVASRLNFAGPVTPAGAGPATASPG